MLNYNVPKRREKIDLFKGIRIYFKRKEELNNQKNAQKPLSYYSNVSKFKIEARTC